MVEFRGYESDIHDLAAILNFDRNVLRVYKRGESIKIFIVLFAVHEIG